MAAALLAPAQALALEPAHSSDKAAPRNKSASSAVELAEPLQLTLGKSLLLKLPENAQRIAVGNPEVVDVTLIHPREVYLLGKKSGTTNLLVWGPGGNSSLRELSVGLDTAALQSKIQEWVPTDSPIQVGALADSLVLTGRVSDGMKVKRILELSEAFSGGKKIINLLRVSGAQQVMLEVKVAEISKTLLDQLGVETNITRSIGGTSVNLLSQLLSSGSSAVTLTRANGGTSITVNAEMKKSLAKVLAEPTITAINGQEGSFLAGGKIFIPVPRADPSGGTVITLVEKEFGVGLRFLPTVLEDGYINLQVTPEVSELSQTGTLIKGLNGQTSLLPSINTRRASTTIQLRDGESFAIGGLIKNNVTQTIAALPLLGEIPILGALFRSTAFQTDQSELLFVVTPRLTQPLPTPYALPTDSFKPPTRAEFFLQGQMQGQEAAAAPQGSAAPPPAAPQSVVLSGTGAQGTVPATLPAPLTEVLPEPMSASMPVGTEASAAPLLSLDKGAP
jgi:pilus assembly protein CpaC